MGAISKNDRMTIHYVWFEDYGPYYKQGINLSSKYNFTYCLDNNKVYYIENNDAYVENFWGDNIDCTAIVGMNGTGKTMLLRFLLSLRNNDLIQTPCVIVVKINSEFLALKYAWKKTDNSERMIECTQVSIDGISNNVKLNSVQLDQRFPLSEKTRFIYLTEMFNQYQYTRSDYDGGKDLSFAHMLHDQTMYGDEEKQTPNPIVRYVHRMVDWQLDFFSNGRKYAEQFNIHYPDHIYIRFNYDPDAFSNWYIRTHRIENGSPQEFDRLKSEATQMQNALISIDDSKEQIEFVKDQCANAVFQNIYSALFFVISPNDEGKKVFATLKQIAANQRNAWDAVYELLEQNKDLQNINAKAYMNFMDCFKQTLYDKSVIVEIDNMGNRHLSISTDDMTVVENYYNLYRRCVRSADFLSFSWGLSSGEALLLNQFGKLLKLLRKDERNNYYLSDDFCKPISNAVIMLDEAEVAFHPEWQRVYFDSMLNFITKNICDAGTHVQIIIATHSPIILSDIPRQNTVFIQLNQERKTITVDGLETFAANIYSLYKNAFFLSNSMVGSYAEKKLKELAHDIQNMDKTGDNSIKQRILLIGDEYIKSQFLRMYHQKMDEETNIESLLRRIKELENQVSKLRQNMQSGKENHE